MKSNFTLSKLDLIYESEREDDDDDDNSARLKSKFARSSPEDDIDSES